MAHLMVLFVKLSVRLHLLYEYLFPTRNRLHRGGLLKNLHNKISGIGTTAFIYHLSGIFGNYFAEVHYDLVVSPNLCLFVYLCVEQLQVMRQ